MQELKNEHKKMLQSVRAESNNKIERIILADSDSIELKLRDDMGIDLP